MCSFDDMLNDVESVFMDAFSEKALILYRPNATGKAPGYTDVGTPRQIRAIIDRHPPQVIKTGQNGVTVPMMISVDNDPITGIDITAFDSANDRVDVPMVLGATALETRRISGDKIEHDGGMIKLKVM